MNPPAFNLAEDLARAARLWPDSPAVARGTTIVHSYAALATRASMLAGGPPNWFSEVADVA